MKIREEKLRNIISWANENAEIRAVLLTSSLVNPLAPVDDFSDLDVELIFEDNSSYIENNQWINLFGNPISVIEEGESCFDGIHAMKMVLYEDHIKVDFKLYSKNRFLKETQRDKLPEDWDIGYKILLDKDGITTAMKPPSHQVSIIKKPTEEAFTKLLNDFWWDVTYVVKCLARGDIFYAKFMSENIIRTEYLVPLTEWYIASKHDWNITTNKHGRLFKKYVSPDIWNRLEQTFSGSDIQDNWKALFAFADVFHLLGTRLAEKLEYPYPETHERNIRKYINTVYHSASQ
ncbi:AadS family aminoglycoside 6-adenylyltransferase [Elizabethkingia meningoseptica]|uniref:AadS family aminoglycoside 6-adenylyltransferase n=1 Tax=Elizabethkingia meningoseptica TaxID=238 RepID=UPI00389133FE